MVDRCAGYAIRGIALMGSLGVSASLAAAQPTLTVSSDVVTPGAEWKTALMTLRPATVIGWHRRGFARF